ncbi:branched-chain amino acid ABC transporter permease [Rhodococcus aetherivorans]
MHLTLFVALIAAIAASPLWVTDTDQWSLLNQALVYIVLAIGFYFVFGLSGQFNFAHGGFFAIGAVVSAKVAGTDNFWLGFLAGIAVSTLIGVAFRAALARVSAIYFAIATFALSGIILIVVQNWEWLAGGFTGMSGLAVPTFLGNDLLLPEDMYWLYGGITIVAVGLGILLERSPLRRYVLVARDSRGILPTVGVDPRKIELAMFGVGCAYAGAAGSMYAHMLGFVGGFSFSDSISLNVFLMVFLGGVSIIWGAVIGAVVLTWLPEVLREVTEHAQFLYAVVLVLVLMLLPKGLVGVAERVWKVIRRA